MLLRAPMRMPLRSLSPRITVFHQTLASGPRVTSPMTMAFSATQAVGSMFGVLSSRL